jgi:hypothetical protein
VYCFKILTIRKNWNKKMWFNWILLNSMQYMTSRNSKDKLYKKQVINAVIFCLAKTILHGRLSELSASLWKLSSLVLITDEGRAQTNLIVIRQAIRAIVLILNRIISSIIMLDLFFKKDKSENIIYIISLKKWYYIISY